MKTGSRWSAGPALATALLAATATAVTTSAAAGSERALRPVGAGTAIAFRSSRDGNPEIYLMTLAKTGVKRLTNDPKFEGGPRWSPDGRRLLFYSQRSTNGDVWVMNADGSGQRNLTRGAGHSGGGDWSPDGAKIVFDSDRAGPAGTESIYVMNADGSGVMSLPPSPAASNDRDASWSPDGKQIAFTASRGGGSAIYLMAADGTNPRQLTVGPGNADHAAWSPRGDSIAFDREQGGKLAVYVVKADGTDQRKLGAGVEPAWSPDGRRLVYVGLHPGRKDTDLFVMNADGTARHTITSDKSNDSDPSWR